MASCGHAVNDVQKRAAPASVTVVHAVQRVRAPRRRAFFAALDTRHYASERAIAQLNLSARVYHRVLKVARTIADLAGRDSLTSEDVAEAIGYRRFDMAK